MIRLYVPADLDYVVNLFTQTVHTVSSRYYSPVEINAWAPLQPDMVLWKQYFDERYTLVMDSEVGITGFGCLGPDGSTLDMLFTHHAHQGKNIGSSILEVLEYESAQRGSREINLVTSATAWAFYQKRGYRYHHSEKKIYGQVLFDCQILHKKIPQFRNVLRRERVMDDKHAIQLLEAGEYGFLAMYGINGYGYGIPVSYVLDGGRIYFHCALEGFKIDSLRENPRVSFCVVGHTEIVPQQFSTVYESAHVFGRIACDLHEEERHQALRLLVAKYSADFTDTADGYIRQSFHRTRVLRLDIEHLSGKVKK